MCLTSLLPVASSLPISVLFFFFTDTATTEIYTLSLHDRSSDLPAVPRGRVPVRHPGAAAGRPVPGAGHVRADRKSTRLNSSHSSISYAVFCLKKKKKYIHEEVAPLER